MVMRSRSVTVAAACLGIGVLLAGVGACGGGGGGNSADQNTSARGPITYVQGKDNTGRRQRLIERVEQGAPRTRR